MRANQQRIPHGGVAYVVAPGVSWTGRAVNLSVGGAFISGGPPMSIGRRLSIRIDLGDEQPPISVHARVAWTQVLEANNLPAGVGVRFVRIENRALDRIAHLVAMQPQPEPSTVEVSHETVRVRVPGVGSPLRASARELSAGVMVVEAEIGWLALGAPIAVEIGGDEIRFGKLSWVTGDVAPSGHARLRLTIDLPAPRPIVHEIVAEPEEADVAAPLPMSIDIQV
jgi:Tfp pilus assembly protein PilZ